MAVVSGLANAGKALLHKHFVPPDFSIPTHWPQVSSASCETK